MGHHEGKGWASRKEMTEYRSVCPQPKTCRRKRRRGQGGTHLIPSPRPAPELFPFPIRLKRDLGESGMEFVLPAPMPYKQWLSHCNAVAPFRLGTRMQKVDSIQDDRILPVYGWASGKVFLVSTRLRWSTFLILHVA
uniref:Uncharacterized protein n=1 Tax=Compsopogon caeruleus TaxID=31354 RepID=A0A7S1TAD6_9RHOD